MTATAQRQTIRTNTMATPESAAKRLNEVFTQVNQRIDAVAKRRIVEFDYVAASPVFPINLDGPGFPVRGVVVMRIFQLDAPTTPLGAGVIDWVPTESGVAIYNLTGVSAGSSYRIALEMIG